MVTENWEKINKSQLDRDVRKVFGIISTSDALWWETFLSFSDTQSDTESSDGEAESTWQLLELTNRTRSNNICPTVSPVGQDSDDDVLPDVQAKIDIGGPPASQARLG